MNSAPTSPLIIAEIPAVRPGVPVRWCGVPASGETCEFTGLGHGYYYGKLLTGPFSHGFVHATLKESGESKGKRLIFLPSLHRLLMDNAQGAVRLDRDGQLNGSISTIRFEAARGAEVPQKWLRVPPNGQTCSFTGLSHGSFYSLLDRAGKRLDVSKLQLPHESRATCLVWIPSLHEYLVSLAEVQAAKGSKITNRHAA